MKRTPPSDEVTRHARGVDGSCGDATCPACRLITILEDVQDESPEVWFLVGRMLIEVGAAFVVAARSEGVSE